MRGADNDLKPLLGAWTPGPNGIDLRVMHVAGLAVARLIPAPCPSCAHLSIRDALPGSYEITGSRENFNTASVRVSLDARQQLRADLKLDLAGVTETVNGEANAAVVNTENATIEHLVVVRRPAARRPRIGSISAS